MPRVLVPRARVQPAIKSPEDGAALWEGLRDGTGSQVGTDSLVYTKEEATSDLWDRRPCLGPGLGTSLPVVVTAGLDRDRVSLEQMARTMADNVARQFDLYPAKRVLQLGSEADVVVFDPGKSRVATGERLPSAPEYTPCERARLYGWADEVFLRGRLLAGDGRIAASAPNGRYVPVITPCAAHSAALV